MSLDKYRDKRKFDQTTEPEGNELDEAGPLRFVVQKHRASHLHYDFRLEFDGVLKSWAVPKGPSLNPEDKRLAMMVEDHPMDYRLFEGVIPKGNYGAGTVMVWDLGTYAPPGVAELSQQEHTLKQGLHKGHLNFVLHGEKLKGEFNLVKLKDAEDNSWLLTKKLDSFASSRFDPDDTSVLTHRAMDEIASQAPASGEVWLSSPTPEIDLDGLPAGPLPHDVKPMLATPVDEPFDREGWFFEVKWDGYRCLGQIEGGEVKLYSRNNQPFNQHFPPIINALKNLRRNVLLDGEIVVVDETGKPRFELLQNYKESRQGNLVYYVFDLLHVDGYDPTKLPLRRRKELLRQLLPPLPNVKLSDHIENQGSAFFHLVSSQGLEGMLGKDAESAYQVGRRSRSWLKVKARLTEEVVIGGFTDPRGAREDLGALVLGRWEDGNLVYAGHAGSGFDERMLKDLRTRLDPLIIPASPFKSPPPTNAPVKWVKPELLCEVAFTERTSEGSLRHPVFLSLRQDRADEGRTKEGTSGRGTLQPAKGLGAVSRDGADKDGAEPTGNGQGGRQGRSPTGRVAGDSDSQAQRNRFPGVPNANRRVSINGHTLQLTNLDKVYWPDDGYKKRDLIDYYREVAPFILPYLRDRPQSLHRHPNGITSESFFQKNTAGQTPDWIEQVVIASGSEERDITYLLCQDEAALVYLANLGCIELNPWLSRLENLENPDFVVIDLDPLEVDFSRVVEAALAVRETLEMLNCASFCKTSGATGIHIYVPLGAKYNYDQSRQFAEIVARTTHARLPETTSVERNPERRRRAVYLDFLQNRHGQTLASVYSVRPKPGATVSTPIEWGEVNSSLDPGRFSIRTVPRRLERVGDLWKDTLGPGIDLENVLMAMSREV